MAIYDCFQYFDEDNILDLRMSIMNEFVDYFVISESTKTHQGKQKKLNFNISSFSKYREKIIYLVAEPSDSLKVDNHIGGESVIEKHQRNNLIEGLKNSHDEDLILLSDSDEIPDLTKLNKIDYSVKYNAFSHRMFMYKLNLENFDESNWIGTRISKKKNIKTMQQLRDIKFKNYPKWRIDKPKVKVIKGGWHFSFLQTPEQISKKIKSYSHGEFNINKFTDIKGIEQKILSGQDIFERGYNLKKVNLDNSFPEYIVKNKEKFMDWII